MSKQRAMKAYTGRNGKHLRDLDLSIKWNCVVRCTPAETAINTHFIRRAGQA
jgi:hypothetical protein